MGYGPWPFKRSELEGWGDERDGGAEVRTLEDVRDAVAKGRQWGGVRLGLKVYGTTNATYTV